MSLDTTINVRISQELKKNINYYGKRYMKFSTDHENISEIIRVLLEQSLVSVSKQRLGEEKLKSMSYIQRREFYKKIFDYDNIVAKLKEQNQDVELFEIIDYIELNYADEISNYFINGEVK